MNSVPINLSRWRQYVRVLAIHLMLLSVGGCRALPAGDIAAIQAPAHASSTSSGPTPVILLRGWRDLWSEGIDQLADKLKAEGVNAVVYKQNQSSDVGDVLVAKAKSRQLASPIVLVGFSYGADDSISNSRRLSDVGQAVDLLILIDPVTPPSIPANVRNCANFYQSNGAWDVFPWLRGVAVSDDKARSGGTQNIDLRLRPDLLDLDTSHKTIAGSAKVHAEILRLIRDLRKRT